MIEKAELTDNSMNQIIEVVKPILEEKDKEIERLKEELKYTIPIVEHNKTITKHLNEIERLNNIINEFDKWLLGEKMLFYRSSDNERLIRYGETKNKWLELKGSDKE